MIRFRNALATARAAALWLTAEAPGAIAGHVNTSELLRCVAAAALAGGGSLGAYQAVMKDLTHIVGPADFALASALLTLGLEVYRRLQHGPAVFAVDTKRPGVLAVLNNPGPLLDAMSKVRPPGATIGPGKPAGPKSGYLKCEMCFKKYPLDHTGLCTNCPCNYPPTRYED